MMSDAEVITILICFHFNSYRNFKHYYLGCVCVHWRQLFPRTFSYNRFVEIMPRCFVALTMFLRLACFGVCTGIKAPALIFYSADVKISRFLSKFAGLIFATCQKSC